MDYAEENKGMNLEEQAQYWRKNGFDTLNTATLSRYFKDKDKIRNEADESDNLVAKKRRVVTYPEVEGALIQWVKQQLHRDVILTDTVLRDKWRRFAILMAIPESEWLSLSNGYLDLFKQQ
ncbi:hypothetical protein BT69DRAFT_1328489 [Atractiella rhizophila]|nr:hypothetical protein BT69DRAFT_1328489 [Atractiella rhizophila]